MSLRADALVLSIAEVSLPLVNNCEIPYPTKATPARGKATEATDPRAPNTPAPSVAVAAAAVPPVRAEPSAIAAAPSANDAPTAPAPYPPADASAPVVAAAVVAAMDAQKRQVPAQPNNLPKGSHVGPTDYTEPEKDSLRLSRDRPAKRREGLKVIGKKNK